MTDTDSNAPRERDEIEGRLLVVDDDRPIREGLRRVLTAEGYDVRIAEDAEEALRLARESPPDLVVSDLNLPGRSGLELIAALQDRGIETTVVVLTGHASIESAIAATRRGVYDYLTKPVDRANLLDVVRRGLERAALRREVLLLRREMMQSGRLTRLVGRSPAMLELYREIEQVAPTSASVLITGESGTGKEVVARTIHQLSQRASGRLVATNCAAIPDALLESEMFGHEKGAFTGAVAARAGCFELADGGSLLLDEIGEMPADLQSKLLRVLEDGVIRRVGGDRERKVDVRVIASTNVAIEELLADGSFREDLYYRLNVFNLHIPPLRERPEDIPLLAEHFLHQFAEEGSKVAFSDAALDHLSAHSWPGNARELRNAVQRALILCSRGEIQPEHLPDPRRRRPQPPREDGDAIRVEVGTSIRDAEKALILATLAACDDNRTRTAEMLGVSAKTLYNKLTAYEQSQGEGAGS